MSIHSSQLDSQFSRVITDPTFEIRLKAFDPNLKLMFDQTNERWCVLEWALDNSGWNIVLVCEDAYGEPMPVGDWVFTQLRRMRERAELRNKDVNAYVDDLKRQADKQAAAIQEKNAEERRYQLSHDVLTWRKGWRELNNQPASDVTAGYRKITPKEKKDGPKAKNE